MPPAPLIFFSHASATLRVSSDVLAPELALIETPIVPSLIVPLLALADGVAATRRLADRRIPNPLWSWESCDPRHWDRRNGCPTGQELFWTWSELAVTGV